MKNKIVVFTPTYNRKKTLPRAYESLLRQSCKEFTWLIIDDGSTDDTKEIVRKWINDGKISIEYYYQENHGKTYAYNEAVKKAKGKWFLCLDSDDYLSDDAIEIVSNSCEEAINRNCIGIIALKKNIALQKNIKLNIKKFTVLNFAKLYRKYKFKGETVIVYDLKLLKSNLFPYFVGEKFVPEQLLYDKMDNVGDLLFIDNDIYYYEYQCDGYTKNMNSLLKNNPKGYLATGMQRLKYSKLFGNKLRGAVQVNVAYKLLKKSLIKKIKDFTIIDSALLIVTYIPACLLYIKKYK